MVPYDHIDPESALLQMWSYVGAPRCRAIVAIGATAGLSVAMFGSMFPMPRVIYAMSSDGLIFKKLSQLWDRTGVPGIATIISGIAAACVALFVRLEILVEMMSIGTLLAYTLVSTCVLVLRYQPHSTSLIDLLPAQLRTPMPPSTPEPHDLSKTQVVTVRKVTRTSPDSDDSFIDDSPEGLYLGRDDQFLVSDRNENKFYGSVHGAPQAGAVPFNTVPGLSFVGRKLQEYSYLCPGFFPWVNAGPATEETGEWIFQLPFVALMLTRVSRRHVRHETCRLDVHLHLLHGSDARDWIQRILFRTHFHLPRLVHHLHSAGDLEAALQPTRARFHDAGTSIHSNRRYHRQHLSDFQAEPSYPHTIYSLDVLGFYYVLLLRDNAQLTRKPHGRN